jgi:hypothetical protein
MLFVLKKDLNIYEMLFVLKIDQLLFRGCLEYPRFPATESLVPQQIRISIRRNRGQRVEVQRRGQTGARPRE